MQHAVVFVCLFLADIVPSAGCLHDDVMKSILSSYAEPHTLLTSAICRGSSCESITAQKLCVLICFGHC